MQQRKELRIWAEFCVWRAALLINFFKLAGPHLGEKFEVNFEEGCMRSMQYHVDFGYPNSAFVLAQRKITENLGRVDRSQDLPDAY